MDFAELSSIDAVIAYVRTFGVMAPMVAFGLFVVQAALPVFPYITGCRRRTSIWFQDGLLIVLVGCSGRSYYCLLGFPTVGS